MCYALLILRTTIEELLVIKMFFQFSTQFHNEVRPQRHSSDPEYIRREAYVCFVEATSGKGVTRKINLNVN